MKKNTISQPLASRKLPNFKTTFFIVLSFFFAFTANGENTKHPESPLPIDPIAVCIDFSTFLDYSGTKAISPFNVNGGSFDPDGNIVDFSVDPDFFTCDDLGVNVVTLTVEDNDGNTATCTANVTISFPSQTMSCIAQVNVSLDINGNATIEPEDVLYGPHFDPCDLFVVSPNTFTCDDIGLNFVTVDDGTGNFCWLNVLIEDKIPPQITYPADITMACEESSNPSNTGSPEITDNCGPIETTYNDQVFILPGGILKILREWTILEWSTGNIYEHIQTIQSSDSQPPVAICVANVNLSLDQFGIGTLPPEAIDAGSYDNCGDVTLSVSPNTFDCSDVGQSFTVILTVTDLVGNTSECWSSVLIEDKQGPTAVCNAIVNISLGADGTATITPDVIDAGSYDNCGPLTYELSDDMFDCSDIGESIVILLTVTDASGNTNVCWSEINVEDKMAPIVTCPADITVYGCEYGDSTDPIITGLPTIVDNCDQVTYNYEDQIFELGGGYKILRTWTVVDWYSGSIQECIQIIKLLDIIAPYIECVEQANVSLDFNGQITLNPEDFVILTTDDCDTNITLSVFPDQFNCSDIGESTVVITATDESGNQSQCSVDITIEDKTSPTAICLAQVNVSLGADGTATITPNEIDAGSYDNCGAVTLAISQSTFSCADILDSIVVILTVTDASGNTNQCWTEVIVEDKIAPTVTCPPNLTIDCSQGGNLDPTITGTPTVVDNCDLIAWAYEDLYLPTCGNSFKVLRTWTVVDWYSGSVQECIQVIKVQDVTPPALVCVNQLNVSLDFSGNLTLFPEDLILSVTDDCAMVDLLLLQNQFNCSDIGDTTVLVTATDECGNQSQCFVNLTIQDTTSPVAVCNAQINISLGADGTATITPDVVDAGSFDECGGVTLAISQSTFDCSDIGPNVVVILTVTDESGNTNECWTEVVVEDKLAPTVTCPPDLTLDCSQGDNLDPQITGTPLVVDNCDQIATAYEDLNITICGNSFKVLRTWTIVDWYSGSVQECIQVIKVIDTTPPNILCFNNLSVSLDNTGSLTLFASDFDLGTTDDCGTFDLTISQTEFDCTDVGNTIITMTATDECGNISQCMTTLTISGLDSDGDGFSICEGDCDDNDNTTYLNAPEICNDNIDNNCNGEIDENCICPSYGQSTQSEWIESISVNGTSNTTGDDGGYGDYTGIILEVVHGNNSVQLSPGFSGNKRKEYWSIWIDFNHNFVFDVNEEVFNDNSKNTINGSFNIPATALQGTTTMRIAMKYNLYSDPCEIFPEGEVEDYTVNISTPSYCQPGGQSTQFEWIQKVQLKSINNNSGDDGGYADYTSMSTNLNPGQNKNIKLQPGYSGSSNVENWRVWVDWNDDGDFDDSGELEVQISSSGNVTGQISVPNNASGGNKIMRVSMKSGGYADPCELFPNGEVEDYTIFVTGSNPLIAQEGIPDAIILEDQEIASSEINKRNLDFSFEMKVYPNPASNTLKIDIESEVKGEKSLKLINQIGQVVFKAKTHLDQHSIDISSDKFNNGIYILMVKQGENSITQKVLIAK